MDLNGKKVLVVGVGKTGLAVAGFLVQKGAHVTLNDQKPAPDSFTPPDPTIQTVWKGHPKKLFLSMDLIVVSPGVPLQIPAIQNALKHGIPVIGELELASSFLSLPVIAITGTNGKTTTTTLTGDMLRHAGIKTFVGGNIGRPLIEVCASPADTQWAVFEVSSFQLATTSHFHPRLAAILNIEPDHLDWHPSFKDYIRSKWTLTDNMGPEDTLVLYASLHPQLSKNLSCKVLTFTETDNELHTAYISGGNLIWKFPDQPLVLPIRSLKVSQTPILLDMLAAGLLAHAAKAPVKSIIATLRAFKGLPHRMEFVGEVNGIRFINDSKATNVDAVHWALKSLHGPIIWLAGGLWKGGDLTTLIPETRAKVKVLIAFGECAEMFTETFQRFIRTVSVSTLDDATTLALRLSVPGDTILLSPACASFDQFKNYKERGKRFISLVDNLIQKTKGEIHALAQ